MIFSGDARRAQRELKKPGFLGGRLPPLSRSATATHFNKLREFFEN
jgi:hypothetical protein